MANPDNLLRSIRACDDALTMVKAYNRPDIEAHYTKARQGYELALSLNGDPKAARSIIGIMMEAKRQLDAGHLLYWDIPGTYDPRLDAVTHVPWSVERSRVYWATRRGETPRQADLDAVAAQSAAFAEEAAA